MAMLNGVQMLAVLTPAKATPKRLTAMLDDYLRLLG